MPWLKNTFLRANGIWTESNEAGTRSSVMGSLSLYFPGFDTDLGEVGDTLVWHPRSQRLRPVSQGQIYPTLCYHRKFTNFGQLESKYVYSLFAQYQ